MLLHLHRLLILRLLRHRCWHHDSLVLETPQMCLTVILADWRLRRLRLQSRLVERMLVWEGSRKICLSGGRLHVLGLVATTLTALHLACLQ